MYSGKLLDDMQCVADYKIEKASTLMLTSRLRGAGLIDKVRHQNVKLRCACIIIKVSAAMPTADGDRKSDKLFRFATSALSKTQGSSAPNPETSDDQHCLAVRVRWDANMCSVCGVCVACTACSACVAYVRVRVRVRVWAVRV